MGDYQTGSWDTDAAEHVAYDPKTQRAFIASAENQAVQVVSVVDPTSPGLIGTVSVSSSLESNCREVDCIYEHMDFGGDGAVCGYADIIRIVHDDANFTCCSFFDGERVVDENMTSPEACQAYCANEPLCSFFSYENECEQNENGTCTDIRHHECYLKSRYSEAAGGDDCVDYVVWEEGPRWDSHDYDKDWYSAAGPAACKNVISESVQSVAIVDVGNDDSVLAAASPHKYQWASGYLSFYDAKTLEYLGCAEAGNKPEGIVVEGTKVACINEGGGRDDGLLEHAGSATVCDVAFDSFNCSSFDFEEFNFVNGSFVSPVVYRSLGVRLYGPDADYVALDVEPEHATFLKNGSVLLVSLQDNNAYAYLDLTLNPPKYTWMQGYDLLPMALDASDKDNVISIKNTFGNDSTPVWGLAMPDIIDSFMIDGVEYVVTANEGDTRDGEDIIGIAVADDGTELEGEETRYGSLGDPSVTTCDMCARDEELGRMLTTTFTPSDFASNACGSNACDAKTMAAALNPGFSCLYEILDYGRGGDDALFPCGFAPNPVNAYVVSDPNWVKPSWYTDNVTIDVNMTTPLNCQMACAKAEACDFFSFEFELGVGECLFKLTLDDCDYEPYTRWHQKWDDLDWRGWSGPGVCPFERPLYTSSKMENATTGSDGGSFTIGGRSMTVWKFTDVNTPLEMVFDTGSMFEELTSKVANGLCDLCFDASTAADCATRCPFNSDSAPPSLDARSDAKGPEPECVVTGVTELGDTLSFVSLERTGGIVTYDLSNPMEPVFQDYLNVRNWLVDETVPDEDDLDYGPFMIQKGLNDGPESLIFVPASDSPIGKDILIAVAPLAGRMTTYLVEAMQMPREDDGSCANSATCPYLSTENGGTGEARNVSLADFCTCDPPAPCAALASSQCK